MKLISGSGNLPLAAAVAQQLDTRLVARDLSRFPDGELHVTLQESVRGDDAYVIQPTGPPVEERLFELLLITDACRRAGAARVTAVMPYFGYARQDRRGGGREPVVARLVADLIGAAGVARVLAVDLHTVSLEGFFSVPVEHLTAAPILIESIRRRLVPHSVLVSPDLGAAKLVERFATVLRLPLAVVHKHRVSGEQVHASAVAGDVRDLAPFIVDDMISTGGTIEAAIGALRAAGSRPPIGVAATHGVLSGTAIERLAGLGVGPVIVTDSLPLPRSDTLEVVSLAPLLADAIDRLHHGRSLDGLILHE